MSSSESLSSGSKFPMDSHPASMRPETRAAAVNIARMAAPSGLRLVARQGHQHLHALHACPLAFLRRSRSGRASAWRRPHRRCATPTARAARARYGETAGQPRSAARACRSAPPAARCPPGSALRERWRDPAAYDRGWNRQRANLGPRRGGRIGLREFGALPEAGEDAVPGASILGDLGERLLGLRLLAGLGKCDRGLELGAGFGRSSEFPPLVAAPPATARTINSATATMRLLWRSQSWLSFSRRTSSSTSRKISDTSTVSSPQ